MKRVVAWVVFVLMLVVVVRAASAWRNPWAPANFQPSAEALRIPGCADKPECVQ